MKAIISLRSSLLFLCMVCFFCSSSCANRSATPVNVGLVMDFSTLDGSISDLCIEMAIEDFYRQHAHRKKLVLHKRHYQNDTVKAASAALDLMKNIQVEAILGPESSGDAEFIANLGDRSHVPIISFTATSPSLSLAKTPYFIRTAQSDLYQVDAIVDLVKAHRWGEVAVIYEDTEFGKGMIPFLTDALQRIDVKLPSRTVFPANSEEEFIKEELYKLKSMQTRVFVVHMMPRPLGLRLFAMAKELNMMSEGYAWLITNGIGNFLDYLTPSETDSMQGVLGVKTYVPRSPELDNFTARWRQRFRAAHHDDHIGRPPFHPDVFGLWAYDTIWALAFALEKTNAAASYISNHRFHGENVSDHRTGGIIDSVGISQTGRSILTEVLNIRFKGLSGKFELKEGQLSIDTFEIVNVIGKGERTVGYWSRSVTGRASNSTSSSLSPSINGTQGTGKLLNVIVWPGDTPVVPRGWVIPTDGKKLRIGVPVKNGFSEFLKVERTGHDPTVDGYCIKLFKRVLEILPYYLDHEFIPFARPDGKSAGTYNELVYQVFLKEYDMVVGDTTVTANRTNYVDFSLPYTETGVVMLVPVRAETKTNALVFLKPLTTELWLTSLGFFVLTGVVVWVLEHRINPEFRGPRAEQWGTVFYFAFSTMVFAHKERLSSNLSRLVIIVWVFVVLILTQSYTASLTSMLTVQQLRPTFTDIQTLIQNGESIGYQTGSFVRELLVDRLKVDQSKLQEYNSPEEYREALVRGSAGGGVAAIFDEMPFIKVFLAKYCDGFTMAGPIYKAGGFAFAFPRGSPMVSDISRAILNVTEGNKMMDMDKALYGNNASCLESGIKMDSSSLSLNRLRGLFLLTGTISIGALIICFLHFVFSYLKSPPPPPAEEEDVEPSVSWRIVKLFRHFDQKDMSSHTFRNMQGVAGRGTDLEISMFAESPLSIPNLDGEVPGDQDDNHSVNEEEILSNPIGTPNHR